MSCVAPTKVDLLPHKMAKGPDKFSIRATFPATFCWETGHLWWKKNNTRPETTERWVETNRGEVIFGYTEQLYSKAEAARLRKIAARMDYPHITYSNWEN